MTLYYPLTLLIAPEIDLKKTAVIWLLFLQCRTTVINHYSRVLVTGGSGFIGQHLILELLSRGCVTTVVDTSDRPMGLVPWELSRRVERKIGRLGVLLQSAELKLGDFDYIFHLAGKSNVQLSVEDPLLDFEYGVRDTLALLDQLRSLPQPPMLLYSSSAAVYGESSSMPIKESDQTNPISPYGVGKLAAENYILVFAKLFNIKALIFRTFSVFGPGLRKQVIYDTIAKLRIDEKKLVVLGTGMESRDFIYIKDLVSLFLLGCDQDIPYGECRVINAATGSSTQISKLIELITDLMQIMPDVQYTGYQRPGNPKTWVVDISKASEMGYSPQWTLTQGVEAVLGWINGQ